MAHAARPHGGGRLGRTVAGLAAALVLLTLVVGLPLVLIRVAGNPLSGLPAAADLWTALTNRDNGQLFLRALAIVGWIAWATFTFAVVVEIPAQIRGRRTIRIPWLGPQQRLAAALVAAVAAVVISPSLSAAAVSPATASAPAAAVSIHSAPTTAQPRPAATRPEYLTHPVQRGESLLSLAERYGVPMPVLAEANYGVVQPDGRSLQPGHTRIYHGWTLRIPVTTPDAPSPAVPAALTTVAAPTTLTTHQAAPSRIVYQVRRDDWLGAIAERYLGDFDRYPEIAALNPQLEARDHRFPDHIEEPWHVVLPADAQDRGPRRHATGHVINAAPTAPSTAPPAKPGQPDSSSKPPSPPAAATPPPTPTPAPTPPSTATAPPSTTASPTPAASTATTAPTSTPTAPSASAPPTAPDTNEDPDHTGQVIVGALTGASLLSALILRTVITRRRRQQQHRRPRRRLPQPRGGMTERDLRVVEQPADVDRLDAALRHLAGSLADRDQSLLPDIIGACITGGEVQVLLASPRENPPPPWLDEGERWTLPGRVALPDVSDNVPPLPTLVTVGSQSDRHLLLDLERVGTLSITGDPDRALALLRYIASELACNSWSEEVDIILAGFTIAESELLVALNPERVRAVSSVTDAMTRLRRRIATAKTTLGHVGAADSLAGRIGDLAGDSWMPQVLLVADPDEQGLAALHELDTELAAAGRCAVAVAATTHPAQEIGHATVNFTDDSILHVRLPALNTSTAAAGLPASELEPLAEIMRQARATTDVPTPPAPETEPWAQDTDAAGSILGLFDKPDATAESEPAAETDTRAATEEAPPADRRPEPERQPTAPAPPAAVPSLVVPARRPVSAAIRQRRHQADPHLDDDLKAWRDSDPTRPRIAILGPVDIAAPGEKPEQRQRFHAEVIVYLAARGARGADRHQLEDALWPDRQVKEGALRTAISRARRWLGERPDGQPWLPDMAADRTYRLADGVLFDWHLFRRLRTRGEAHGPAGVRDLRAALELVRGVTLDGADRVYAAGARNPFTWLPESDIYPPHIVSAIVDTAHELARLYLDADDTINARWAVHRAWLADPYRGDDELWHDIMRAEYVDGHAAELRHLLAELMRARDAEVPEDLQPATYEMLRALLPDVLYPTGSTPVTG